MGNAIVPPFIYKGTERVPIDTVHFKIDARVTTIEKGAVVVRNTYDVQYGILMTYHIVSKYVCM